MTVSANHISTDRLLPSLGALIVRVICFPQFGVTTSLNWALNRQPLGSNASTASNNKATISAAHSCIAFQFAIIIPACLERRFSDFSS